ncbi:MAG: hypothetical protein OQL19_13250 [Gammaproteobacteria bacterium]|nr:hypothetical protein [Gammaproteobacteria bacterium]
MDRYKIIKLIKILFLTMYASITSSFVLAESVSFANEQLETININKKALYPESIQYNPITEKYVVGSFRDGKIYEIDSNGDYKVLINDKRISSALGIQVDTKLNRLLVATADIGSSTNSYNKGIKKLAALGIFDLTTGEALHFINLGELIPKGNHLANGLALDKNGNAYITDSFYPVIYKVDTKGKATVFLESTRFKKNGINLNGLIYHPDGYLIVAAKTEGILFKIPLSTPSSFTEIKLDRTIIGLDGVTLVNKKNLVVVANRAANVNTDKAFSITSNDNWETAQIIDEYKFRNVYPTTSVIKDNKIYVLHSNLNELVKADNHRKKLLTKTATIQQIGNIIP